MHGKLVLLLWGILFLSCTAVAQEGEEIKSITSKLADALPEQEDFSELAEQLSYDKDHKINLNAATPEQLKALVFLSDLQISNFFNHIQTNGKLLDLLELQSINTFDNETIEKLLPYVTLKPVTAYHQLNFKQILHKGSNEIVLRYAQTLEKEKGFTALPGSRYLGSPQKLLIKYRYNLGDIVSASFVMKKDAGESFFNGAGGKGFDFISGNLAFRNAGKFSKIVLGDYSLQFGQGLSLWSGFSFGKGADVAGVAKRDTGLKPYTSASEYSFFRGLATTLKLLKNIDLTSFISLRSLDASLTKNDAGVYTLSNINSSGLHRTKTEIANKGDLRQFFYGSVLQYNKDSFSIGMVATHADYQHEFITGSQLYNKFGFTGTALTNLGVYYNYAFRNSYFFGETARSIPGGLASLNGVMTSLSPMVSAVILYRNYAKDHINFYSQGIGEGAEAMNEKGIYTGININPGRAWALSFYTDVFRSPWLKYRIDAGSNGNDLMGQLSYMHGKVFKVQLRFKTKETQQNTSSDFAFNPIVKIKNESYRLEINWKLNKKFSSQSRMEVAQYKKEQIEPEFGYLIYQDIDYKPVPALLTANMRLAYFHTPSYNSRIYAYEDDVLYGSGSGLYNGKGIRTFLNLKYRLSKQIDIWGRYAVYFYPGQATIGSGLTEINGDKKSELKFQLRYQF